MTSEIGFGRLDERGDGLYLDEGDDRRLPSYMELLQAFTNGFVVGFLLTVSLTKLIESVSFSCKLN